MLNGSYNSTHTTIHSWPNTRTISLLLNRLTTTFTVFHKQKLSKPNIPMLLSEGTLTPCFPDLQFTAGPTRNRIRLTFLL